MHASIKKVSEDYEKMKFNTAIAQMMSLVNEFYAAGSLSRGDFKALLLLLNPVAPHITEEMWEAQGFGEPVYMQSWPQWDENKLKADTVEIAVQVCGKVRGRITIPADLTREQAERELPENADVKRIIGDKVVRKVIYVPG